MEQKELQILENKCIQENPPACTAACPIHVNVRDFVEKIKAGNINGAFEVLRKKQPFPGIIGRICDHPCQLACKRQEAGEAISIANLEKFCVENYSAPLKVLLPPKKELRIAIVGGGLSGLTAAFDLAKKGYQITIFEAADRLGRSLWELPEEKLPRQVILNELAIIQEMGVETKLNTRIGQDISLTELRQRYNAVFMEDNDLLIDPITYATDMAGVFAGGSRVNGSSSLINSVSDGRRAAISIDRYLQNVSLTASRHNEGAFDSLLFTNTELVEAQNAVKMHDQASGYNKEEAIAEAGRCLQCECLECVKACHFLRSYRSYPKKYLREIYNNESIVMGQRHANKMINSCSACGLCEVVCPNDLNMGEVCKKSRESMVQRGKMPPSAHDFALRDMVFNNSDKFAMCRHQPGTKTSKNLFFPGCQLSGSAPEHVEQTYSYLRDKLSGGVGIMLRCCGAPAEWAGQQEMFQAGLQEIADTWENMGKPRLIISCSTCYQVFKNYLPELKIISLWEIFQQHELPYPGKVGEKDRVAVHDACTTRMEPQIHLAVREILARLNYDIEELDYNRDRTQCCGFGGLMSFANPEMAGKVVQERIEENHLDYISYCAMCRDNFAGKGKPSLHLLDLIFGKDHSQAAARKSPGYSQRHENRAKLKNRMLRELWGEKTADERSLKPIKLIFSDEVKELMESRFILVEDLQKVIEFAERTGNKLVNKENGNFLAYKKNLSVTYWVEYAPQEDGFVIHNTYSHRMEIGEEVKS